jgi:hypothetical protein
MANISQCYKPSFWPKWCPSGLLWKAVTIITLLLHSVCLTMFSERIIPTGCRAVIFIQPSSYHVRVRHKPPLPPNISSQLPLRPAMWYVSDICSNTYTHGVRKIDFSFLIHWHQQLSNTASWWRGLFVTRWTLSIVRNMLHTHTHTHTR